MHENTPMYPSTNTAEAWRAEVDEIIASIKPVPQGLAFEPGTACEATLVIPTDDDRPPALAVAQTQPAAPCLSALVAAAPASHTQDEVTTPVHPVQQASLRAACVAETSAQARPCMREAVIEAVAEVRRQFGPGLIAEAYARGLVVELALRGIEVETYVSLSVQYKGHTIENAFVAAIVADGSMLIDVTAGERPQPSDTCLEKLLACSGLRWAVSIDFGSPFPDRDLRFLTDKTKN